MSAEMDQAELKEIAADYADTPNVTNVRIQKRTFTTTPWEDVADE